MRITRLAGPLVMLAVTMGLAVASSAAAFSSNPLFNPANDQTVLGEGGTSFAFTGAIEGSCERTHIVSGNVSTSLLVDNIVIHYLGCTITKGEEVSGCAATSVGQAEGLILTNTLHAILGLLLPSGEIGVLLLPLSGTFTIVKEATKEGKLCIQEARVTGSLAALASPVGVKQTTGKIKVLPATAIDLTHGLGPATSKLVVFSEASTLSQEENLTFGEATEVT